MTTESSLSTIWVLNARKLEIKYLAIYTENLSWLEVSDVTPYHKIEKPVFSYE